MENDPAILLDVDLDHALPILVPGSFHNAGQVCQAIKRVFLPRRLKKDVVDGFSAMANDLYVVGRGLTEGVTMGPVNNQSQKETVTRLVDDARSRGARVHEVGTRLGNDPGYFLQPTILSGVEASRPIAAEEQFGPALPTIVYPTRRCAPRSRLSTAGSTRWCTRIRACGPKTSPLAAAARPRRRPSSPWFCETTCLGNAVIESFGYLEEELFHHAWFTSVDVSTGAFDEYLTFYNTDRIFTNFTGLSQVRYRGEALAA